MKWIIIIIIIIIIIFIIVTLSTSEKLESLNSTAENMKKIDYSTGWHFPDQFQR